MAARVLSGMMRTYVINCGIREVRRKKPLTNPIINGMDSVPDGTVHHGVTVDRTSYCCLLARDVRMA